MRLSRAMLFVKDLPRMTAFYRDRLGLQAIEETRLDDWVEFDAGGARFALHSIPAHLAAGIEISSPPIAREKNPVKLIFEVDDVEWERERLRGLGVPMIQRPWGASDGVDPEGNIFQISQSPSA
ncbi:MAG: VOC family protein [Bryobacterales bacterium]|nr:VOC family protein [Bryobacterales bacterium]MBV9401488.1 VOC family protein [Bryobacterales bacterium]